jgi:hypothetical protein
MAKIKYNDTFPLRAEDMARKGLIDKQIAKNLGISHETLYQYQKKFPEFSDALKRGKAPVDVEVENALLKRAKGFEYEEVHTEYRLKSGETEPGAKAEPTLVKRIKKVVVPDVTACIFWLKNRRKDEWRDMRDLGIFDELGEPLPLRFVEVGARDPVKVEKHPMEKEKDASKRNH